MDHLGSILTVTNTSGNIEAEQSFDGGRPVLGDEEEIKTLGLYWPPQPLLVCLFGCIGVIRAMKCLITSALSI